MWSFPMKEFAVKRHDDGRRQHALGRKVNWVSRVEIQRRVVQTAALPEDVVLVKLEVQLLQLT